jgi:hypothetical protein
MAGNITLTLSETEQAAFHQLLDMTLRNAGMNAFAIVSHFVGRITAASQLGAGPSSAQAVTPAAASSKPLSETAT